MKPVIYLGALLGVCLTTSAFGEPLWIKSSTVVLREGKSAVYNALGKLAQGQQVDGIKHESGWVQINTGTKIGWVSEASVAVSKVNADSSGSVNTTEMSTAAAGRGLTGELTPDAQAYIRAHGINRQSLDYLRQIANDIKPPEWEAFTRDVHR